MALHGSDGLQEIVTIYSPESAMKQPLRMFRQIIADFPIAFRLAQALASRDISAMYRQSLLGYVWAFLPPLGTAAVFLFLRSGGAFRTEDTGMPYSVFVLVGTLLWQVFADSLNGPLKAVANSRSMLVKIRFPQEALVLSALLVTLFNFVVRLGILIPALCWFAWQGQFTLHLSSLILFPLGVLGLIGAGLCHWNAADASRNVLQRHLAGPADNPDFLDAAFPCGHDPP